MTFQNTLPYNDLPPLPPKADLETVPVLKAVTTASRALAELKGRTGTLPNPAILTNTIALQEAKASSEIENLFTTHDELYKGLTLDDSDSPHAKEVLHYNDALWLGARRLTERPVFSTNLFIEIVETIKQSNIGIRAQPGTKIANSATGETVYTPPEGESVIREKLANLESFCNHRDDDGLDPLVKMAVLHYQFEAIHPFYDGNGRTGRILLILYLLFEKLLDQPILYLSRFIIERKADYYRLLRGVTERGDWEPWLLYMLHAVESTARQTSGKIQAIGDLLNDYVERSRDELSGRASKELIELLFVRPYCKIRFVEDAGLAKRVTASRYLHELAEKGFVTEEKVGAEILFINHRLIALLQF